MEVSSMLEACCAHSALVSGSYMFSMGGSDSNNQVTSSVERYDSVKDVRESMASMSVRRAGMSAFSSLLPIHRSMYLL